MLWILLLVVASLAFLYLGWKVWSLALYHWLLSPIQQLPGPELDSFFGLTVDKIMEPVFSPYYHDTWVAKYGKTMRIHGFGKCDPRILTLDPRAMMHVLNHVNDYPKPWQSRLLISELIGNGLFAAEGPSHRRQRKVLTPAFSNNNLLALAPIFTTTVRKLCSIWNDLIGSGEEAEIDIMHWISRATFDVIGLAGFDYRFNALEAENNPVYLAYREMFQAGLDDGFTARAIVELFVPVLKDVLPSQRTQIIRKSHAVIYDLGRELLQHKKSELDGGIEMGGSRPKDLLTLMLMSNCSPDVTPEQRISDRDMLDEINSFFFAGSDSTSLAVAWAIYLLASCHDVFQDRLRAELTALEDNVPFGQIDALPFLDKVCKEALRLIPPVHSSLRVAAHDDILPLSTPVRLLNGKVVDRLPVPRGTAVHVPIEGFNLLTSVWGRDAHRFNPDRWDNLPAAVRIQPGLYANLMTFSAGPRACIGLRFSIIEMKIFLFHLVRSFDFEAHIPVVKRNVVLLRPFVRGKRKSQLPLMVRRVSQA